MIDRNAERLLRLVEDLLITAQASAGNLALEKGELDIAAIIAQAVQAGTPVATARGIVLNCSTEPLPAADGDRLRIGQVIDNLVSNALKFTPAGGTIDVRAYPYRSAVRIEVADTGMGIAENEQAQLFDRFFRTARAQQQAIPGVGLGLSISKAISMRTAAASPSRAPRGSARLLRRPARSRRANLDRGRLNSALVAAADRYDRMPYRRCGRSGLKLPAISLGLWQNFGGERPFEQSRETLLRAFDLGVTHFDLANNYGPPYGSAEETFGKVMRGDFRPYRDELVISTKAGYDMWPGPYGEWGSRKYLLASLEQSLARLEVDYVDIFYSHRLIQRRRWRRRWVRSTPRCATARRSTPASRHMGRTARAKRTKILSSLGTPLLIHQPSSTTPNRWIEPELLHAARRARCRLHRLLAARAGHADRQVPERGAGELARGRERLALVSTCSPR